MKGTNTDGGSFFAIYGSDDIRSQWTYQFPIDPLNGQTIPGNSISLSKNGGGTAVGGFQCNPTLEYKDGVICYDFGTQRGPINVSGDDWGDSFGTSVSLNNDSTVLAVGSRRGRVYVYVANTIILTGNLSQSRIGNIIEVGSQDSTFGELVKVVGTPTSATVVVGGRGGKISAYRYSANTNWRKIGGNLPSDVDEPMFEVSENGNIIAMKYRDSIVRVYEYIVDADGSSSWVQRGQNIFAESGKFASLSLSSNGNIVAVGSYNGDANSAAGPGVVKIYEYVSNDWQPYSLVIEDFRLEGDVDFGRRVSLSSDGKVLAVAAPAYSSTLDKTKGYAAVFEVGDPFPSAAPIKEPSSSPSRPPTGQPTISPQPTRSPVPPPSALPSKSPTDLPTISAKPSFSPTKSRPPTFKPSPVPTPSTCTHDCDCKEGSECDLSECRYNCNCKGGFCDMRKCEYDCRCKGGNCNMNRCGSNCQCEMRGCQMDNCIYNSRCVASRTTTSGGMSTRSFSIIGGMIVSISLFLVL